MSKLVKTELPFLQLLGTSKSKAQTIGLLRTMTKQQLYALSEIAYNLLEGVIPVTPAYKKKLARHKKFIRLLASKQIGFQKKKTESEKNRLRVQTLVKATYTYLAEI